MDRLDLLENVTAFLFCVLPLLGLTLRNRIAEIVFSSTNYGLGEPQQFEILRRVEFVSLLVTSLVATEALVLAILAYHHKSFPLVLAAFVLLQCGIAVVAWGWSFGPTWFGQQHLAVQYAAGCWPLVLLLIKLAIVYHAAGIDDVDPRPDPPVPELHQPAPLPSGSPPVVAVRTKRASTLVPSVCRPQRCAGDPGWREF